MKKILTMVMVLIMLPGLFSAALAVEEDIKVGYTLSDPEDYFFMDREYALIADDTGTTADELETAGAWLTKYILNSTNTGESAFDFTIGGVRFSRVLSSWSLNTRTTTDNTIQTDFILTYTKAGQPLTVTVYVTAYKEYAIIEWTVYIENTGSVNSAQIADFDGLKQTFSGTGRDSEYKLTWFRGSLNADNAFEAQQETLSAGAPVELKGTWGKPSEIHAPYLNVQWEDPQAAWGVAGVFVSVGWSGQWYGKVTKTGDEVEIIGKQERLDTYLKPGEKIRSPLMTLLFWEKDLMRSQNLWRRWVYNVAMPQPGGEPIPTQLAGNTAQTTALTASATTANQIAAIQLWMDLGLEIDGWQMDAGWYDMAGTGRWEHTGNWYADPARFPEGDLSAIGAELAKHDLDFILWYEPERVVFGTDFYSLTSKGWIWSDTTYGTDTFCFNLSIDEATDYLINFMLDSLDENGVTVYRQDANITYPAFWDFWTKADEPNRGGLTENQYIVNYLRFLDAIVEATGTYVDNCASGGRRLDLESMKRGVALWRCDHCYDPLATQSHSWGINFFMPYSGQGSLEEDPEKMTYAFRSNMMPSTLIPWRITSDMTKEYVTEKYIPLIKEHKAYAPFQTADYYPLTSFSTNEDVWMAWQFHDYKIDEGIIQVFRRAQSTETSGRFYLSGLDADITYTVTNIDGGSFDATGRVLMANGLTVDIAKTNTALIFHYEPKSTDTPDPGNPDPGTTDPGTTNPGTTDPGTTNPGTTDPGTTDPGAIPSQPGEDSKNPITSDPFFWTAFGITTVVSAGGVIVVRHVKKLRKCGL